MKKIISLINYKLKYYFYSFLNVLIPKTSKQIFIFDKYHKKDNAWAIAKYITSQEYLSDYLVYYYTDYPKENLSNLIFLKKKDAVLWKLFRSKYIIYSYRGDDVIFFKSFYGQKIIDTMHGSPLKNIGYLASNSKFKKMWAHEKTFDYILSVSDLFTTIIQKAFNIPREKVLTTGYPRNDVLFKEKEQAFLKQELHNYFQLQSDDITVLWMPTWRQSRDGQVKDSSIDFPILHSVNMIEFNNFLKNNQINMLIKIHPHQAHLDYFQHEYSHIKIIDESTQLKNDFYEYLPIFSGLITDYSSVIFDYLLINKPIAFSIEDYREYSQRRGFTIDNPKRLMPGPKLNNLKDLKDFLIQIKDDIDPYRLERQEVAQLTNRYLDSNSTKRLLKVLKII